MKKPRPYRKFQPQKEKISLLEEKNPRFKRIYEEYETLSDELWNLESSDASGIPDDFISAIRLQTDYLEQEIGDWLNFDEDNILG